MFWTKSLAPYPRPDSGHDWASPARMKSGYVVVVIILFVNLLLVERTPAQVLNVEKIRSDADTTGWVGELGFNLSLNKFNDRVLKMGSQGNLAAFTDKHAYLIIGSIDLVNVDGASLISQGYVHGRSTFLRKRTFSPELFVQVQYNENYGLKNRFLTGGGVRYRFLSLPKLTGYLSTGLMFEHEEWGLEEDVSVQNDFIKSTSNLVLRGEISPQASLVMTGYYQARPDDLFKPRATYESQLNLEMTRRLTFRVSFVLTYDVDPVIDVPNLTYELKNGLVLVF